MQQIKNQLYTILRTLYEHQATQTESCITEEQKRQKKIFPFSEWTFNGILINFGTGKDI